MWITYSWGETCRDTKRSGWHLGSVSKLIQAITTFLGIDTHGARSHVDISAPSAPVLLIEETCVFPGSKTSLSPKTTFGCWECFMIWWIWCLNFLLASVYERLFWPAIEWRMLSLSQEDSRKLHNFMALTMQPMFWIACQQGIQLIPTAPWCDLGDKPKISNKKTLW